MADRVRRTGIQVTPEIFRAPNVTAGAGQGLAQVSRAFFSIGQQFQQQATREDIERGRKEGARALQSTTLNDGTVVPVLAAAPEGTYDFQRSFEEAQRKSHAVRLETVMRSRMMDIANANRTDPASMAVQMQSFADGVKQSLPLEGHADFDLFTQKISSGHVGRAAAAHRKRVVAAEKKGQEALQETQYRNFFVNGQIAGTGEEGAASAASDAMDMVAQHRQQLLERVRLGPGDPRGLSIEAANEMDAEHQSNVLREFSKGLFSSAKNKAEIMQLYNEGQLTMPFPSMERKKDGTVVFSMREVNVAGALNSDDRENLRSFMSTRLSSINSLASSAVADVDKFISLGVEPPPEKVTAAMAATENSPKHREALTGSLAVAKASKQFRLAHPAQLQGFINDNAGKVKTIAQARTLKAAQGALQTMKSQLKADGMSYANSAGAIELKSLDQTTPTERIRQALEVKARYGAVDIIPFTDEEVTAMAGRYKEASAENRVAIIQSVSEWNMPDDMEARTFAALSKKDPSMGVIANLVLSGSPSDKSLAIQVATGMKAIEADATLAPPHSKTDIIITEMVDDAMIGDTEFKNHNAIRAAADALYLTQNRGSNVFDFNAEQYEAAVEDVVGQITKVNGRSIILPRGMSESAFEETFDSITDEQIHFSSDDGEFGPHRQTKDGMIPVSAEEIRSSAQLVTNAPGEYLVQFNIGGAQKYAVHPDGSLYFLNINRLPAPLAPPSERSEEATGFETTAP